MSQLDKKNAAVFGAASGIGRAIALGLATNGATVACLDIDGDGAKETAETLRGKGFEADSATVDIRRSADVNAALDRIYTDDGRLDIVISTPGINVRKPLIGYTDDEYDAVVDVNLRGSFHVMRHAGKIMSGQGHGSIVLISSISSRAVEPNQVIYAGTKAAIAQMVRVLAAELGSSGVRVNAIAPGPVETALTEPIRSNPEWLKAYAVKSAAGRWAAPHEMAGPAVFLSSDAASYVSGTVLFADGGWVDMGQEFQSD